jgi:serine/threonine protein kinase
MVTSSAAGGGVCLPPGVRPLQIADPVEIGGHRLVGRLGSGGMGVVYLGHDRHGSLVAIKAAHEETADEETADEESRHRLRAEAACARRVPSAYTARLLVDGTDQRPPYIILDYIAGRSLEDIVENDGPFSPERLRALATGVAGALAAIHHAGLIHRDLKPANVLLTPTGPRVIDFGIAQGIPASGGITKMGVVMGSPGWISPERLTRSFATPAADIFCWGCLIAYAGTGRNPFGDGDPDEVAWRTIREPPDLDGLDPSLRRQVEATLAKDPADRPSARELIAWLSPPDRAVTDRGPRHGRHVGRASTAPRRRMRRVMTLSAGSAAVAVVATLTVLDADRSEWRTPGAAAAPPRAAGPHRRPPGPAVSRPSRAVRGATSPASVPRMPSATQSPVQAAPVPGKTTVHDRRQRTGITADPAETADRVARATTVSPTTEVDKLLHP